MLEKYENIGFKGFNIFLPKNVPPKNFLVDWSQQLVNER
jgi:hypothetical protein